MVWVMSPPHQVSLASHPSTLRSTSTVTVSCLFPMENTTETSA